jgi:GGDEF domain-containing protein
VVSLFKTATEMDRLQELHRTAIECLGGAMGAAVQYAVQADPGDFEQFREHLLALQKMVQPTASAGELGNVKASFRGELRDYQHLVHERLARLREEVKAAAAAMQTFADGVIASGADYEEQLDLELQALATVSKSDDLAEICGGIHAATSNIAGSVEKMRRSNQLVIAQLQDEIRILHQEIQAERRASSTDRASGAWNQEKIKGRIEELFRQDEAFSVLLIRLRNLEELEQRHSRTVVEGTLKAVLLRLHDLTGPESMVGRWSAQEFVAILPIAPPNSDALSSEVTRKLTGEYTVQENGLSHAVKLQVGAGIVERHGGVVSDNLMRRVEQLSLSLGSVHPKPRS